MFDVFHRWIEKNNWIPLGYVNWWMKRKKFQLIESGLKTQV
jgi:type II restriction/modification system DNA methylase subunit YeeA